METYEIYLNGSLISSVSLSGLAHLKFESARLLGDASLFRVSGNPDPVLGGRYIYDTETGGWGYDSPCASSQSPSPIDPENNEPPPKCSKDCLYRHHFNGFDLQRNALRSELASMIYKRRCGWNIKPGHIGGHPLDYAPCTYKERP